MSSVAPQEAGTVPVHVQVLEVEPFSLDMVVPTYLPARDLTQRVARDAGLGAYWEDGTRRRHWLRVRGRLLEDHERLDDVGVVPHELLHLLPQPREDSGLVERPPEYPPNRGYSGAGNLNVAVGLLGVLAYTAAWIVALGTSPGPIVGLVPGAGLGLVVTTLSRHLWGGEGSALRIPLTALVIELCLLVLVGLGVWLLGPADVPALAVAFGSGFIGGIFGVMLGWLAWYGAVEPLPEPSQPTEAATGAEAVAEATWPCAICGGAVTADVRAGCGRACGRVFHAGCLRARQSLAPSAGDACGICGATG